MRIASVSGSQPAVRFAIASPSTHLALAALWASAVVIQYKTETGPCPTFLLPGLHPGSTSHSLLLLLLSRKPAMRVLRSLKFLLLASFVAIASGAASPAFRNLVLHEQRQGIPDGFVSKGAAPAEQTLNLRIALVQGDMAGLEKALFDVSTPGSELYGQHLTKEEVQCLPLRLFMQLRTSPGRSLRQAVLHLRRPCELVPLVARHLRTDNLASRRLACVHNPREPGKRHLRRRLPNVRALRDRQADGPDAGVLHPDGAPGPFGPCAPDNHVRPLDLFFFDTSSASTRGLFLREPCLIMTPAMASPLYARPSVHCFLLP